tara:strand:+ start:1628 stop:2182 length:555 start_codon:yes stop_codon:yes gene_type:complete
MKGATPPWFPAWCIQFNEPISNPRLTATTLLDNRNDNRWLLLGFPTAASERHLWATWLALRERVLSENMVSNSLDGEFLRLIAGTHQMSVAFKRAGIQSGEDKAWLVRIPEWESDSEQIELPHNGGDHDDHAFELMSLLQAELLPRRPIPTTNTLDRLEIEYNPNEKSDIERLLMTYTATVDID